MPDKKSLCCFMYAFFTIIVFGIIITMIILAGKAIIHPILAYSVSPILFFGWIFANAKITKKQQAVLLILQSQAILTEKIQESHRGPTLYYLYFKLDDGSKKSFKVERDIYSQLISKLAWDLRGFFVPDKAEDAALLAQVKDDNAVRHKKDRKDESVLRLTDYMLLFPKTTKYYSAKILF